jgi:hypothetical protein
MNLHPKTATAIALIAAAAMVPAFAPAVQAQTVLTPSPAQFQHAQQALEHQIIARQVQLVLLGTEVANAANVTTSDRSALVTIITNEQSGLATDATNAAAATTVAELATVRSAARRGGVRRAAGPQPASCTTGADHREPGDGERPVPVRARREQQQGESTASSWVGTWITRNRRNGATNTAGCTQLRQGSSSASMARTCSR